MRITGGTLKGLSIDCPPGEIRPSMDRMRESVFAILGSLEGASFLDLFTGSGIIALEAASRGASRVRAVERDEGKRRVLKRNLAHAPVPVAVSIMPAERFVAAWKEPFDYIFFDPPFDYPYKSDLLRRTAESRLVHAGTVLLIHYPKEDPIPDTLQTRIPTGAPPLPAFLAGFGPVDPEPQEPGLRIFSAVDQRSYGRSQLRIYRAVNRKR